MVNAGMRWRAAALVAALLLVLGADVPATGPVWRSIALPTGGGRAVVREILRCGGWWYAFGAVVRHGTRPAVWRGRSGRWQRLTMHPVTYYGHRHTLYSGACRNGRVAAVGAAIGGAHGNPRTSTWYQRGGAMIEVHGPFELYGGPDSVAVTRIAGGPLGWVIVGGWISAAGRAGGAAWRSTDGVVFHRIPDDPALASAEDEQTTASDVAAVPGGWLAVGARTALTRHLAETSLAWWSADGRRWRREPVPGGVGLQRVAVGPAGTYAVGPGVVARRTAAGWRRVGAGPAGLSAVEGLVVLDGAVYATAAAHGRLGLWSSATGSRWTRTPVPVGVPATGATRLLIAGAGPELLLAADTGHGARLWLARL